MHGLTKNLLEREKPLSETIKKYAKLFEIDPNIVRALITQESAFVAEATSPTGAYGYGQFTGIGARQVYQNISQMDPRASDLDDFRKSRAFEPEIGIKAICATLWWLYHVKYKNVEDKVVRLEATLTFYNAGGRAAALVVKHEGHSKALPFIQQMPRNIRSQGDKYAPQVAAWYLKWHEHYKEADVEVLVEKEEPVVENSRFRAVLEMLMLLNDIDEEIDVIVDSRDGLTEVTIILPGEYQ